MAGTLQVQSYRKQLNLKLRRTKDSPPETPSQAMTEDSFPTNVAKTCCKNVSGKAKNMRSDGDSCCCNTQHTCRRQEDSLANEALDTAPVSLTEDWISVSTSKTATMPKQYFNDRSGGRSVSVCTASNADPGQSTSRGEKIKKISNEIAATVATDKLNLTYLKTPNTCQTLSNIIQSNDNSPVTNVASNVTNTNTTCYKFYPKQYEMNRDIVEQLPQVPQQSLFYDPCECKDRNNQNACTCIKYACPEEVMSQVDTISREVHTKFVEESAEQQYFVSEAGVQTSFVSIQETPCYPGSCPRKKPKAAKDLVSRDVQTDSRLMVKLKAVTSSTSGKTPSPTHLIRKKITIATFVKHSIPHKRTQQMEDRLLRRIIYFDSNQSSVCNRDVEFCTYKIHRSKKTTDPHKYSGSKKACPDCRSDKKCVNAISENANRLTCDEIAIEVVSLELPESVVFQLLKACFFVYIDYVFLGHVGNETFLAPVSKSIQFDHRRSYCVSLKYNKKERSILREQVNPTGLLAKDSIMFILVCHAAPEFDILKNWDFAYGYLSMKNLLEQNSGIDIAKWEVEMTKIGSTEKIGMLNVIFEGLELVRTIRDEVYECIEPRPGLILQNMHLNKKYIKDIEKEE